MHISLANGWQGIPSVSNFDAIHVGAAASEVPQALVRQLRPGGCMIVPVGPEGGAQELLQVDKGTDGTVSKRAIRKLEEL